VSSVVVPFREGGKSRLPAELRSEVALAMLGDVLEAAIAHADEVVLVSDDAAGAALARVLGVATLADPGHGQAAAVAAALARVDGLCLVVNADLPCVTAAALERLAQLAPAHVQAPDGTTNALSLPDPTWFRPLYGEASASRFAAAGLARVSIPELEHDVDTVTDLEDMPLPAGRRTELVLNQHNVTPAGRA
jgi:2-phospho-L-lactate guanylyltransferase